jgi:predicted MFS family arabinose efflux permease
MRLGRDIVLFVIAMALLGCAGGIFDTTSNNYYAETFRITAEQRGDLELPREFPGFMVAVMSGVLFFVAEVHLGVLSAGLLALGMLGLAAFANQSHQYANMLVFLVMWSAGAHLSMPVTQSLALTLAEDRQVGMKLGALASLRAIATVVGCAVVWVYFRHFGGRFSVTFALGGGIAAVAAVVFLWLGRTMPPAHHGPRPKLVLKRRYGLFYVLSILFGARKQVFLTFGPWVLIRLYQRRADTIAELVIIATVLAMGLMPVVGWLLDRLGERCVLMADAALSAVVCLSYGFAGDLFAPSAAFLVVCGAFVLDQFLFGVQMARTTYLSKIAENRADIGGTLGMGVSLDHAVSIPVAMLGGRLWQAFGSHRPVFMAAACVAFAALAACSRIRIPQVARPELVRTPQEALEDVRAETL